MRSGEPGQAFLREDLCFIDDGYSGTTLIRPALDRLRDAAAAGILNRLYIHSPDRLARKYAYQVLLVDEFQRCGVEVVFLNRPLDGSAEDQLLLQVQGMIAEYERAKLLELSPWQASRGAARLRQCSRIGTLWVSIHPQNGRWWCRSLRYRT